MTVGLEPKSAVFRLGPAATKVVLVAGDNNLRGMLVRRLHVDERVRIVGATDDPSDVPALCRDFHPDVLLLDWASGRDLLEPVIAEIEALAEGGCARPLIAVLAESARDEVRDLTVDVEAVAILLKKAGTRELVDDLVSLT